MPLAKKNDKKFTYSDYVAWPDDERWELIDGEAYSMTPAPTTRHQNLDFGTPPPIGGVDCGFWNVEFSKEIFTNNKITINS